MSFVSPLTGLELSGRHISHRWSRGLRRFVPPGLL